MLYAPPHSDGVCCKYVTLYGKCITATDTITVDIYLAFERHSGLQTHYAPIWCLTSPHSAHIMPICAYIMREQAAGQEPPPGVYVACMYIYTD